MSETRPIRLCRWCDDEVEYNRLHRMWFAIRGKSFYCVKDDDPDWGQHIPQEVHQP